MINLSNIFMIQVHHDQMSADISFNSKEISLLSDEELNSLKQKLSVEDVIELAKRQGITYGLQTNDIRRFLSDFDIETSQVTFAVGTDPVDGLDGELEYHVSLATTMELKDQDSINFKEIMVIPKVEAGKKLVTVTPPTNGKEGTNIYGEPIQPNRGKPARLKTGKNTEYSEEKQAIFATENGQVSLINGRIQVLPVYEVSESISLKTGNIDFNGSIIVHGDVPEGFMLKARGDITINGTVEAAHLDASGSIFIRGGVSAQGKGLIKAGLDIHVRNVNQGNLKANRNIIIENSCLHSQIEAKEMIRCYRGHMIGGQASAGESIEGNDIGNRHYTKTFLDLGVNRSTVEQQDSLSDKLNEVIGQIKKLKMLGEKLEAIKNVRTLNEKEQAMYQRQENSLELLQIERQELQDELDLLVEESNIPEFLKVNAHGTIYPNVIVSVGKYNMVVKQSYKHVSIIYSQQDFSIVPLN